MDTTFETLLQDCQDEKIRGCLSKLGGKGTPKLQRYFISKFTKDILCDTLMFIAEKMFPGNEKDHQAELSETVDEEAAETQTITEFSSSQEEINQTQTTLEDKRSDCLLFLSNKCPNGIRGKNCSGKHPKQCRHFLQGGRSEHGCREWKCPFLHPKICKNDYLFGSCQKKGCKERHTKQPRPENLLPEASPGAGSFLWQKQFQDQIDQKFAEMNQRILQVLGQQKSIPIWSQPSQEQFQNSQPRWGEGTRQ